MPRRLSVEQTVRGTYHRVAQPGEERAAELHLEYALTGALLRERRLALVGWFSAPGLAERAEVSGEARLELRRRRVVYELSFVADDGSERRFHGEVEVSARRALRSAEEIVGHVYRDESEEARVLLRGSLQATWAMLRSLGLR